MSYSAMAVDIASVIDSLANGRDPATSSSASRASSSTATSG